MLVVGKKVGERVELGFGITDQFLPGHFVNGDSFDFGKGNGPVLLVRGKAQFTVELKVLAYGPAAGEKIDGSFQPDLAGWAVEAIWPVVCLLIFFGRLKNFQFLGCLVGLVAKPSGSGNLKVLKPLVVLHSVLEISDFAFSVGGQFLCLLRIKGKRVFLHALVSVLDEERTIYCILGVAKAYAQGGCWQTIRVVPFTDYVKKGVLGVKGAQVRGGRSDPLAQ